jgi:hypothetical protein
MGEQGGRKCRAEMAERAGREWIRDLTGRESRMGWD